MSTDRKKPSFRNLSLCPLTPDPTEVLDLIAELKRYLKTVKIDNDAIYRAYFEFDYDGTTYRMDDSVLSANPAAMWKAEAYITERLYQFGADAVSFYTRED